ncbi:hypothetical protein [Flavobacterium sp. WC2509]|uniref:hypothetical protein n=1 Tax=Flavobacterium sp. WC2509 TaxID=3461406 RepID=UPI0040444E4F
MRSILKVLASIFLFIITSPILAQPPDPGPDPDAPVTVPIDDHIFLLAFVGIIIAFMRFKSIDDKKMIK